MLSLLASAYPDMGMIICRLDENEDGGKAFQDYLEEKTGQRTVPNVFIRAYNLWSFSLKRAYIFLRSTAYWR